MKASAGGTGSFFALTVEVEALTTVAGFSISLTTGAGGAGAGAGDTGASNEVVGSTTNCTDSTAGSELTGGSVAAGSVDVSAMVELLLSHFTVLPS